MNNSLGHIFGDKTRVNRMSASRVPYQNKIFLCLFWLHNAKGTKGIYFQALRISSCNCFLLCWVKPPLLFKDFLYFSFDNSQTAKAVNLQNNSLFSSANFKQNDENNNLAFCSIEYLRGVFRTQFKIYDETFCTINYFRKNSSIVDIRL